MFLLVVSQNLESRLKVLLPDDVGAALMDGVVLCHLANHIRPRSVASIHVPSPAVVSPPTFHLNPLKHCGTVRESFLSCPGKELEAVKKRIQLMPVTWHISYQNKPYRWACFLVFFRNQSILDRIAFLFNFIYMRDLEVIPKSSDYITFVSWYLDCITDDIFFNEVITVPVTEWFIIIFLVNPTPRNDGWQW